jgi:hypothetical protein
MKTLIAALSLLFGFQVFAEDHPRLASVKTADKARVAAMQLGDREKLDAVFSDELRYAHSNGIVDTKKSFIEILSAGKTKYVGYDYEEQNFTFAVLSFLAVWREEKGQWRFLAWQSCKLPAAVK